MVKERAVRSWIELRSHAATIQTGRWSASASVYNDPMKAIRQLAALFLFLAILAWKPGSAIAQSESAQFFPETGHYVKGNFLHFYQSSPDPRLVFGYPLTEEITSKDGKTVQYFQRARFELRRDLPEAQRAQLTPLGQVLYQRSDQLRLENTSDAIPFPQAIRSALAFLDFSKPTAVWHSLQPDLAVRISRESDRAIF